MDRLEWLKQFLQKNKWEESVYLLLDLYLATVIKTVWFWRGT